MSADAEVGSASACRVDTGASAPLGASVHAGGINFS